MTMLGPLDAEHQLRSLAHSIGGVLDQADDEAEPGSRRWNMLRAGCCAAAAEGACDPHEAKLLTTMALGYLIASEALAPDPHPLLLRAAAEKGLILGPAGVRHKNSTVGVLLAAAAAQHGYASQGDEPMSPDFGWQYPPMPAQRRWVAQRRSGTAEAVSATRTVPAAPRSKGIRKVRIAQEARARARLRAVSRFRHRRGT
jgi:hypothetical protein